MLRRILLWLVSVVLLLSACTSTDNGVEEVLEETLAFYMQRGTDSLTDEEVLAILNAGGQLDPTVMESHLVLGDQAVSVTRLCRLIYLAEGFGQDIRSLRGQNLVQLLSSHQREDAAFGYLEETLTAALTLENVGGSYDRDGVLHLLIVSQRPDGSFVREGEKVGDPALTGQALMLLSCLPEDNRAITLSRRAISWLEQLDIPTLDCSTATTMLLGLLDQGRDTQADATVQALLEQLLDCRTPNGAFSTMPGGAADDQATWRALTALDAMRRGGSYWNTLVARGSAFSIEIHMPDGSILYGNRLRLQTSDTALLATVRFCAGNGISLEYRLSEVLSIGEIQNAGQVWQPQVNGQPIPASRLLQPGDILIWKQT